MTESYDVLAKSTNFGQHLTKHRKCKDLNTIVYVARVVTQGIAHQVSAYKSMLRLNQILFNV